LKWGGVTKEGALTRTQCWPRH